MKKLIFLILLIAGGFAGYHFIYNQSKALVTEKGNADIIKVFTPKENQKIYSPLVIEGKARGMWFFEASFPIVLTDWDGKIIAEYYAQAHGDWMTEDYVPFSLKLEFEKPAYGERGFLILKKDNPSGLPEYDDSIEIPVIFR